jgi:hypothetical protein
MACVSPALPIMTSFHCNNVNSSISDNLLTMSVLSGMKVSILFFILLIAICFSTSSFLRLFRTKLNALFLCSHDMSTVIHHSIFVAHIANSENF